MSYNLELLKDKEVRTQITKYANGELLDKQIIPVLDKICGKEVKESDPKNIEVKDEKQVEPSTPPPSEQEIEREEKLAEMNEALSGNKPDLERFADENDIDLTEATNNDLRKEAIQKWFDEKYPA